MDWCLDEDGLREERGESPVTTSKKKKRSLVIST